MQFAASMKEPIGVNMSKPYINSTEAGLGGSQAPPFQLIEHNTVGAGF